VVVVAEPNSVSVHVRFPAEDSEFVCSWGDVDADALSAALPWRTFRWHRGQKHYSGSFWSVTENDLVIYESRLELARLLFADFDVSVRHIVAQPFLLRTRVAGVICRHIPDYLLFTSAGPLVVDVKPRHRVARPENAFTFEWTKRVVESRGWRYEVWSEPHTAELENVRFLAGYRRGWLFDQGVLEQLRVMDLDGATLGAALGALPTVPEALVRATVLHLLWQQHFTVDLTRPLSAAHVLRRAG
jgi:hypothetical protein